MIWGSFDLSQYVLVARYRIPVSDQVSSVNSSCSSNIVPPLYDESFLIQSEVTKWKSYLITAIDE